MGLQVKRRQIKEMDAISMLLTPSLPWLSPACNGCEACPLNVPTALQKPLQTIKQRLQL